MHRAPSRRRPLILAVLIALALVVAALALPRSPAPVAATTGSSVADECQAALGYPARTSADRTWLRQCVHALTPPTVAPTPSATGTPSPSPTVTVPPTTPPATTPPATTPPATTPPPTTTPPATTPPPSPSPTPTGVCSTFATCGFPTAANTGVPAGTVLTPLVTDPQFGMVISTAGTVIDGRDIQGYLIVQAPNVTIKNSRITSAYWWGIKAIDSRATGLQILDNEITSAPTPFGGVHNDYAINMTLANSGDIAARNNIHGFRNGIDVAAGLVVDNYIHDPREYPTAHSQPIYGWCNAGPMVIDHNTLISDSTNSGGQITYASGTVYIADDCVNPPHNDRTVNNNWLVGGSLTVYGGGSLATNIRVTGNHFSTAQFAGCGFYGYGGYFKATNAGNVWSGNVWADGVNAGKTVAAP